MCKTLTMKTQPKTLAFDAETSKEKTSDNAHKNEWPESSVSNLETTEPGKTTKEEGEVVDGKNDSDSKIDINKNSDKDSKEEGGNEWDNE